jgi:hypothetical protein
MLMDYEYVWPLITDVYSQPFRIRLFGHYRRIIVFMMLTTGFDYGKVL